MKTDHMQSNKNYGSLSIIVFYSSVYLTDADTMSVHNCSPFLLWLGSAITLSLLYGAFGSSEESIHIQYGSDYSTKTIIYTEICHNITIHQITEWTLEERFFHNFTCHKIPTQIEEDSNPYHRSGWKQEEDTDASSWFSFTLRCIQYVYTIIINFAYAYIPFKLLMLAVRVIWKVIDPVLCVFFIDYCGMDPTYFEYDIPNNGDSQEPTLRITDPRKMREIERMVKLLNDMHQN